MTDVRKHGHLSKMLVSFLIGSASCAWGMIILPRATAAGYLPPLVLSPLFAISLTVGPYVIALYIVLFLSGWRTLLARGEHRQAQELFFRYAIVLFLGAALTGFAFSVFKVITSHFTSTAQIGTGVAFLFAVLVTLWFPKFGVLMDRYWW